MNYLISGLFLIVVGTIVYGISTLKVEQRIPLRDGTTQLLSAQSKSAPAIDVAVDKVNRTEDSTEIFLVMNNHSVDLGKYDPMPYTTLDGVEPLRYEVDDSAVGGHHLSARLIFEGTLNGTLNFGLSDELRYNFEIK